ncbi:MAG: T9SS type A sorting domain-containing protein [Bacteroidales bacterium]|nr:T9SS type A sorting domain-containing protein [Bacteroidales bacterium]
MPLCAGVDGFRLGVVMDDVAIFYWNQGLSGRYQCSLGPADSEPEDNALVEFADGQNFLRYTDLPDGEYKACVRRVCYHDCYFHRDSTYYSDWSEPIAFRVGDPPDDTVSVRGVPQLSDVTLVPNPATLQVTVTSAERIATVTLTDMSGREVLRLEVNAEQTTLDISTLPKGVYLATIVTPQATTTKRLVVN